MNFFPGLKLSEANGGVLAQTVSAGDRILRKGMMLGAGDIELLRAAGHDFVNVAKLAPGDVLENAAAARIGAALCGAGLRRGAPVHGRIDMFAEVPGLLRVDARLVNELNGETEAIALATLPDRAAVAAGDMVATLKIIPFAVPGETIAAAVRLGSALRVAPFRNLRVGLGVSVLPHLKPAMIEKTVAATRARICAHGSTLLPPVEMPHETARIADAIRAFIGAGAELVLVAGASAATDRMDVAPRAIVAAGGEIIHFGMPVDPGNLTCLGRVGGVPVIILPGCARSPAFNGIDLVLHRIFAGEQVGSADIAAMGVGGLLKKLVAREAEMPAFAPRIAAIVLAAGRSTRFGGGNKLLAPMPGGGSMIARTVDHARASGAHPVIVVTGHDADNIRLAAGDAAFVHAANYESGMSASLRAGITALPADIDAAFICLGDMPLVGPATLRALISAYAPGRIIIPVHNAERGNPVLWDRQFFPALQSLTGDSGGRQIMRRHAASILELPVNTDAVLRDFDTAVMMASL